MGTRRPLLILLPLVWLVLSLATGCESWRKRDQTLDQAARASQPTIPEPKPNPRQAKIDLLLAMAQNDERDGQFLVAAKKYQEILEIERHPRAVHRSAILAVRLGDDDKAERLFAESIQAAPEDAEWLADVAYWKYLRGDLDAAQSMAQRAIKQGPYSARAHNHLGLILAQQGKTDAALRAFELAGCDRQQALANARHALLSNGQIAQADALAQRTATDPRTVSNTASRSPTNRVATMANYSTK